MPPDRPAARSLEAPRSGRGVPCGRRGPVGRGGRARGRARTFGSRRILRARGRRMSTRVAFARRFPEAARCGSRPDRGPFGRRRARPACADRPNRRRGAGRAAVRFHRRCLAPPDRPDPEPDLGPDGAYGGRLGPRLGAKAGEVRSCGGRGSAHTLPRRRQPHPRRCDPGPREEVTERRAAGIAGPSPRRPTVRSGCRAIRRCRPELRRAGFRPNDRGAGISDRGGGEPREPTAGGAARVVRRRTGSLRDRGGGRAKGGAGSESPRRRARDCRSRGRRTTAARQPGKAGKAGSVPGRPVSLGHGRSGTANRAPGPSTTSHRGTLDEQSAGSSGSVASSDRPGGAGGRRPARVGSNGRWRRGPRARTRPGRTRHGGSTRARDSGSRLPVLPSAAERSRRTFPAARRSRPLDRPAHQPNAGGVATQLRRRTALGRSRPASEPGATAKAGRRSRLDGRDGPADGRIVRRSLLAFGAGARARAEPGLLPAARFGCAAAGTCSRCGARAVRAGRSSSALERRVGLVGVRSRLGAGRGRRRGPRSAVGQRTRPFSL